MLEPLTRPFKRHYDKYRARVDGFVGPIKESASKLYAMIPKGAAFAGSEDLGQESDGSTSGGKPGLLAKIKDFKKSIKESWGAFDVIGTLVVIGLCACFYAYFW
jgi:hypothetical protein